MVGAIAELLDSSRLLFELHQANDIARCFAGCLEAERIARITTEGLVERFGSAFARIWLVEPDGANLRLVASSGLYTSTDGSFAKVPMGAYKVGKIAHNRVAFLSNNLPEESWVKDREWAIANQIRGFAGFPLMVGDRVIGVLATFSHAALEPEFLEVLQVFCTVVAVALETALIYQQEASSQTPISPLSWEKLPLSDQLAATLKPVRLTLIGTERSLPLSHTYVFLQMGEVLNQVECGQCRLSYGEDSMTLEATVVPARSLEEQNAWLRSRLRMASLMASCLGGQLQSQPGTNHKMLQVRLSLPYSRTTLASSLTIQCSLPVLQFAFTQLAFAAGLQVEDDVHENSLILTNDIHQIRNGCCIIWVKQDHVPVPKGVRACIDFHTTPAKLRSVVEAVQQGEIQEEDGQGDEPLLSEREREILGLLAQGLRDRDIANQLIISESTVKFHMNNVLTKLKARTRYQALYQATMQGEV